MDWTALWLKYEAFLWRYYYEHRRLVWMVGLASLLVIVGLIAGIFRLTAPRVDPEMRHIRAAGTVAFKGEPLEGACVVFHPNKKKAMAAFGMTDVKGAFLLKTADGQWGAMLGTYRVTVTKQQVEKSLSPEESRRVLVDTGKLPQQPKVTDLLPPKYGSVKTTPFLAEVSVTQGNQFSFELQEVKEEEKSKDKKARPYVPRSGKPTVVRPPP
jgi:hypothetical protein